MTPPIPSKVRQALTLAAQGLARVSDTPRLDAELLMADALGIDRDALLLGRLDDPTPAAFAARFERRLTGEPLAYITGRRAFWTLDLAVGPGVLIPRPDSETLLEAAIAHFDARSPATILDLGTGPGTLLLAALNHWPVATGLGVDRSVAALDYALLNAKRHRLDSRIALRLSDWAANVTGRFDLILANPPYIATEESLPASVRDHEPPAALFAGADGLDAYRRIVPDLPRLLQPGGVAVLEIGWTQAGPVTALLAAQGFTSALHHDLGGRPRALIAQTGNFYGEV